MREKKTRSLYMHTIEGKPATWSDRSEQIVYVDNGWWCRPQVKAMLRTSLRQIRRDQERTRANRKAWGMDKGDTASKYGYVLVEVPDVR